MPNRESLALSVGAPPDQSVRDEVTSPDRSYIVQAPAGSGKTTLLVERFLRLLAGVRQPEEILAITFTKKAAREMKSRILTELTAVEPTAVAAAALNRSKQLKWDLELNSQRLRVQTIDSFAYGLVQRMPCESQLNLDYQQLGDADEIYFDAVVQLLGLIRTDNDFADDIADILAEHDNNFTKASNILNAMVRVRQHWIEPIRSILEQAVKLDDESEITEALERARESYIESALKQVREQISPELLETYITVVGTAAEELGLVFDDLSTPADWRLLSNTFLTKSGTLRKSVNKNQGFPPDNKPAKEQWAEARDQTGDSDNVETLELLQNLPDFEFPESHSKLLVSTAVVLSQLLEQLNEIFRQREIIDFTELSFAAQRALGDEIPTDLAMALDYRISHILIDEYQDTSQAQFDLLGKVMATWTPDSGNTFFAVGDPMQSIYSFREADLSLFQNTFKNGIPYTELNPRVLSSNFRSTHTIVERNNEVFELVFGDQDDPIAGNVKFSQSEPTQSQEGKVSLTLCPSDPDSRQEAEEVAKRISELADQYHDDSIGMLCERRTNLRVYFEALDAHGLKWKGVDIVPLTDEPVVRDLYSLVKALNDDRDRLAWLSFFRSPLCGLDLVDLEVLSRCETGSKMLESSCFTNAGNRLLDRVRALFHQARAERHYTFRSQIERLWFRLGGMDAYREENSLINAERFLEQLEHATSGEIRMDELWSQIEQMYASENVESADVEIMTIHKAKGLEFDHVVLPDLNRSPNYDTKGMLEWSMSDAGLLIGLNVGDQPDAMFDWLHEQRKQKMLNERKRLLYVAMTRARKSLSIFGNFKDEEMKTRNGSLLSHLEPFFDTAIEVAPKQEVIETTEQMTSTLLTRLKSDYQFEHPNTPHSIPSALNVECDPTTQTRSLLGFHRDLALGNLVHRELHRITETGDFTEQSLDSERMTNWRNFLRAEGLEAADIAWVIETAQRHINNVLDDEDGRWLLDGRHQEATSESPYSAWVGDSVVNIRIDRTFVDENNTRWIIDFKTALIGKEENEDLREYAVRRYAEQLRQYEAVVRTVDARPIRCAIYLTDIPTLIDLTEAVETELEGERLRVGLQEQTV